MENWQIEALEEVDNEVKRQNPLLQKGVRYVEFVSRSNGRKRSKRKHQREVRLVSFNGRTVSIGTRLTRKLEFLMQDVFPESLCRDREDDWLSCFVIALREAKKLTK